MTEYYDKVLKVCERYLTSGGKRLLDRQITTHLSKTPDTLTPADKTELAKWCKISGGLLLGKEKAEDLERDILSV